MTRRFSIVEKDGQHLVEVDTGKGYLMRVIMSEESYNYFSIPGCECGMLPILELQTVYVTGQDDCPVHGI